MLSQASQTSPIVRPRRAFDVYVFSAFVFITVLCVLAGCKAGRGPAGEVIVGWDVAQFPETAQEGISAAAKFLPPPFDALAIGVAGTLFGGGAIGTAARSKRQAENEAYDMGQRELLTLLRQPPATVPAPTPAS